MQFEDYLDFSEPDAIRLKGHRIGLEHVVEAYKEGESPEQIAEYYDTLSLEQVYATITYYLRHRAEVDAYLERLNDAVREQMRTYQPAPVLRRIHALINERHKVYQEQA